MPNKVISTSNFRIINALLEINLLCTGYIGERGMIAGYLEIDHDYIALLLKYFCQKGITRQFGFSHVSNSHVLFVI